MQSQINQFQLKYPFNGRSKYLIDKFCIIGFDPFTVQRLYEESSLHKEIETIPNLLEKKSNVNSIYINESSPMLLSEISSDYTKEIISYDIIKDLIFPKGCEFFYYVDVKEYDENNSRDSYKRHSKTTSSIENIGNINKFNFNKRKTPDSYNVIFSNNPQIENNSKKSINCFAYVFYKKHEFNIKDNKILNFYVPFTFCIVSEFPFYNSFYLLCSQLHELTRKQIDVPLEVILYNIVNFAPSPFNNDIIINLDIFLNYSNPGSNRTSEKNEENINTSINEKVNKQKQPAQRKINNYNNNKKKRESIGLDENNIFLKGWNKFQNIRFELLSGYPLIQYNLLKVLLHKMSPEDVITIFFYIFLERNVIFFSNDIELLSLTINSYINLNFPLNDEKYYFNNVSISFEDFISGNSNFAGTAFTSVLGINSEYKSDYLSDNVKLGQHLTVDLDNGVIKMIDQDDCSDNEDEKDDENIFKLFKKIFTNKVFKDNIKETTLYIEVKNIHDLLCDLKKKITDKNDKHKIISESKFIDYDDEKELIKECNKNIQEAFYSLVNNLCTYFYQNLFLKTPENFKEKMEPMDIVFNDNFMEEGGYINEEVSFLKELRQTMKFQSFTFGFIKSYNPIDLYKIPLSFTEEFLSVLSSKSDIYNENKNKFKFLPLIDSIYKKKKKIEYKIDFTQFYEQYTKNYKNIFDMDLIRISSDEGIKVSKKDTEDGITTVTSIQYINLELENSLIFRYKNLIDNIEPNEDNIILNYIKSINTNNIENINTNFIEDTLERYLITMNIITVNDICLINIIILYIINIKNLKLKYDNHIFLTSLFDQSKIFRKYYTMLLEVIYYLLIESIKTKNYEDVENYTMIYYLYINSLRNHRLIPNENLFKIIQKFDLIEIPDINKINETKNENNKEFKNVDNDDDIYLNYIYISKNFTPKRTISEEDILKYYNNLLTDGIRAELNEANTKKVFNPRIKINHEKTQFEHNIMPQTEIFGNMKNIYYRYIMNGLDTKSLNIHNLIEICSNIIIYFKYMDDFNEKEEINSILYDIYNSYIDIYLKEKKS